MGAANAARAAEAASAIGNVCALCLTWRPTSEIDVLELREPGMPVCSGCLAELHRWCDERRDAVLAEIDVAALPWECDEVAQ